MSRFSTIFFQPLEDPDDFEAKVLRRMKEMQEKKKHIQTEANT